MAKFLKKHHNFLSKLAEKNGKKGQVKSVGTKKAILEKRVSPVAAKKGASGKKIGGIILAVIFFCGFFYWALQSGLQKFAEISHRENEAIVAAIREIVVQEIQPLKERQGGEKEAEKTPVEEKRRPAEINIRILNGGAPKGSAGKAKELLATQGYARSEAGNVAGSNVDQGGIYYKEDKFAEAAKEIGELLARSDILYASAILAMTDEEKSADIVIVLGKSKSVPAEEPAENSADQAAQPGAALETATSGTRVKIVSRGAPGGYAEEIKNILQGGGYEKAETGRGKGEDIIQTLIFFNEEKFRTEAQAIRELLIQKEQIYSALREAESAEEKSADVVIMLGENKEAPPN